MNAPVERGSPPTTYAILAMLEGEPGAEGRVVYGALQRSLFIAPGLYLAGVREPSKLICYSLSASASITACLIGYYWLSLRNRT